MRRASGACAVLTAILLPVAACTEAGTGGAAEAIVRDSAGITIMEHPASNDVTPQWSVRAAPDLEIGVLEGPEEYQLERVVHAAILSDGRIVIADAGAHALRFYAADGTFQRAAGRRGAGPGEFEYLAEAFVDRGDSIHVWDPSLGRMSVFSSDGDFVRSALFEPDPETGGRPQPIWLGDDGTFLTWASHPVMYRETGVYRDSTSIVRYGTDGERLDVVGRWPGPEIYVHATTQSTIIGPPAVARRTHAVSIGDAVYVGDNDRYEIRVLVDGRLAYLIRRLGPNRALTPGDVERIRDVGDDIPERFRRRAADMPIPETLPAFNEMLVDAEGSLWISDFRAPSDTAGTMWRVYDPDGRQIGTASTPARFQVTDIGADRIIGIARDEAEVERVRVHRFTRATSP